MCRYDFDQFRCRHFFPTGSEPCGHRGCRRRLEQIHTLEGLCPDCAAKAATPSSPAGPPPPPAAAFFDWLADQQGRSVGSSCSGRAGGARPGFPRRVRSDSTVVEVGSPRSSISDGNWGESDAGGAGPRPVGSGADRGRPVESNAGAAPRSTRRAGTGRSRTGTGSRAMSTSSSSSLHESGGGGRPRSTARDSDDFRAAAPPAVRTSSTAYEMTVRAGAGPCPMSSSSSVGGYEMANPAARATSVSSLDESSPDEHGTGAGPRATNSHSGTVYDIKSGAPSRRTGSTAGINTTGTARPGDGNAGAGPGSGSTREPHGSKTGAGPRSMNSVSMNAGAGSRSMGSSSKVHNKNIGTGPRSASASNTRENTAGVGSRSMGSSSSYESNAAAAPSRAMRIIGRPETNNDTGAGPRPASSSNRVYETNTAVVRRSPRARDITSRLYEDDPRAGTCSTRSSGYKINTSAATHYESRTRSNPPFRGNSGYETNAGGAPRALSTTSPYEDNETRPGSRPTSRGSGGSGTSGGTRVCDSSDSTAPGPDKRIPTLLSSPPPSSRGGSTVTTTTSSSSAATAPPTGSGQLPLSTTLTSTQGTNRSSFGTFVERCQPKQSRSSRPGPPLEHADSLRSHPISPALTTAAAYLQVPPPPQQQQQRLFQTPAATTGSQDISAILFDDRGRSLPGSTPAVGTLRRANAQIHARGHTTSRTSSRPASRESDVIDNELWAGANKHEDTWGLHEGRQRDLEIERERWSQALITAAPSAGPGSIKSSIPTQGRARPRRAPAADEGGAGRPSRTAVDPDCGRAREAPNSSRSRSRPRQSPARSGLDLANKPLPPLPIDDAAAAPTAAAATPAPPSSHYNDELFFPSPRRTSSAASFISAHDMDAIERATSIRDRIPSRPSSHYNDELFFPSLHRTSSAASFISAQDMDALERATSARDRLAAEPAFHDNDELFFPSPRRTSSAASFMSTEDMDVLERATSVRDRLRSHLQKPVRRPHFSLAELDDLLGYGPGPAGAPAETSDDLPNLEKAPHRGSRV